MGISSEGCGISLQLITQLLSNLNVTTQEEKLFWPAARIDWIGRGRRQCSISDSASAKAIAVFASASDPRSA